jgi:hypothetical protein
MAQISLVGNRYSGRQIKQVRPGASLFGNRKIGTEFFSIYRPAMKSAGHRTSASICDGKGGPEAAFYYVVSGSWFYGGSDSFPSFGS